jgi:hypothetical protein
LVSSSRRIKLQRICNRSPRYVSAYRLKDGYLINNTL